MKNEMPNEIYVFRNSNGGLELGPAPDCCDWLVNIKYIRADSQPADVAEALAIADARGDEVKELDFGNVFWACGVLAEKVRALTAQQPDCTPKSRNECQRIAEISIRLNEDGTYGYTHSGELSYQHIMACINHHAGQQQPDVNDENNTNVLCHDCSKIYEHEYNQPPRHGSCEVCGRKNMLCTRVMTRKARAEQRAEV